MRYKKRVISFLALFHLGDAARNKSISFGAINGILSCYTY